LPDKQAATERRPWQDAHTFADGDRHVLPFDVAHGQAVLHLHGGERDPVGDPAPPEAVHQLVGRIVRAADVEHLAGGDQIVERADQLVFGRGHVLHVDLVEVDPVGVQAAQAVVHAAHHPTAGGAGTVRSVAHLEAELGGEHHLVAPAGGGEPLADHALGEPVLAVHVGGVPEVHPGGERALHHREGGGLVGADPVHEAVGVGLAERHGAEAEGRDLHAGVAE
jgi:hypothetical protein